MRECKNCIYYSEYNDGTFTTPVCKLCNDLKSAVEATKNAESCQYKKLNDICLSAADFKEVSKAFQNLCDATNNLTKETQKFLDQLEEYNKHIEAKDAVLEEFKKVIFKPFIRVKEWLASILNRLKNKKTTKK